MNASDLLKLSLDWCWIWCGTVGFGRIGLAWFERACGNAYVVCEAEGACVAVSYFGAEA